MKETLHNSPDSVARGEDRREITDVRVLSALAHPVRLQLLGYLLEMGPRTATQCSTSVDASPSACSYHLRHLERFGLVERAAADERGPADGRERLWRAAATGFRFGTLRSAASPAASAARHAVTAAQIDESARLAHRFLEASEDVPAAWLDASALATYGLALTPDELTGIVTEIDAILRPYIAATRTSLPTGTEPVHVTLQAFLRTERER